MYVETWRFDSEHASKEVHSNKEQYASELKETVFIEEIFDKTVDNPQPVQESDFEHYQDFMLLDSNLRGNVHAITEGTLHNIYIKVEGIPDDIDAVEGMARAIINVGRDYGGSRPEVSHYTSSNSHEISVQFLAGSTA